MDFEQAKRTVIAVAIFAGFASAVVAMLLARRRALIPTRGLGWMVTDAVPGGVGHPSMLVIDCYLSGGADIQISFTVQMEAGLGATATIARTPSFGELRSQTAARVATITEGKEGVWQVDALLAAGSALRIRLYDVDLDDAPRLLATTRDIDIKPLDRRALGHSFARTLGDAFRAPLMLLTSGGIFGVFATSGRFMDYGGAVLLAPVAIFGAFLLSFLAITLYQVTRFGGLILSHLASDGFRQPKDD